MLVHRQRHDLDAESRRDAGHRLVGQRLHAQPLPGGTSAASVAASACRPLPVKHHLLGIGLPRAARHERGDGPARAGRAARHARCPSPTPITPTRRVIAPPTAAISVAA